MKALDTPVLLDILHDAHGAKELLQSLHGEEIATTELNLFELRLVAAVGSGPARNLRENALAKLRRRLTVLPVTSDGVAAAGKYLGLSSRSGDSTALVWGVLSAAGCSEWITTKPYAPPKGKFPFRVRIFGK
jgi:predicted nucleic acid-binding protein